MKIEVSKSVPTVVFEFDPPYCQKCPNSYIYRPLIIHNIINGAFSEAFPVCALCTVQVTNLPLRFMQVNRISNPAPKDIKREPKLKHLSLSPQISKCGLD